MAKNEDEKEEEAFFSDSISVLFNPEQFVIDFKQSIPQVSPSKDEPKQKTVTWHKPVMVNPLLAKKLSEILKKNVEKFEEKFGEIKVRSEEDTGSDLEEPSYIG